MPLINKRLEECLEELQNILEEDELAGIPLLFFANKQDLITALEPEEIVEQLQLDEIDDRDWSIFG
jgi:ADP-ribosylation factor-like protein 3